MQIVDTLRVAERPRLADVIALGKPRLSLLVVCTAAAGLWLAPNGIAWWRAAVTLVATTLLVTSANGLNSYLERDRDAAMRRTRRRPLPAGVIEPQLALNLSLGLATVSVIGLALSVNAITALLGSLAFVTYTAVYTPLKPRSSIALFVGAVPGAIPPMMGWSAATGSIDETAAALFAVLFLWQLPHFIAISVYLGDDYERGGFKVFSHVYGPWVARVAVALTTAMLIPATLSIFVVGAASTVYAIGALTTSVGFLFWVMIGICRMPLKRWARRVFVGSIIYLTLWLASLMAAH